MTEHERAPLTKFNSIAVVSDLTLLQQHQASIRLATCELNGAHRSRDLALAAAPMRILRDLLDRQGELIVRLKGNVVPFDRHVAGDAVGSVAELVLRAQTLVIEAQLLRLCDTCGCAAMSAQRYPDMFIGRLHDVCDVAASFRDRLHRTNLPWLLHRRVCGTAAADAPIRRLYPEAIARASADMLALRYEWELAHFLRAGATLPSVEISDACKLIGSALNITLAPPIEFMAQARQGAIGSPC